MSKAPAKTVAAPKQNYTVYSTLTGGQNYVEWKEGPDLPIRGKTVSIAGGAGVAGKRLITPYGVGTPISEEDKDFLESHPVFQQHMRDGWIKIVKHGLLGKADPDKVADDMMQRDGGSPVVPNDFDATQGYVVPKINGKLAAEGTVPTTKPRTQPLPAFIGAAPF